MRKPLGFVDPSWRPTQLARGPELTAGAPRRVFRIPDPEVPVEPAAEAPKAPAKPARRSPA
jgi:hypothetical protein